MRRREFLGSAVLGGVAVLGARVTHAQQGGGEAAAPAQGTTSNLFDMDQAAAKTVRRPPKPGASQSMTPDERDALERDIRCQCGCTLDVYICRTTDFSCQVSPAMHRDIISLVDGGYSAKEILDAFVSTYGEQALMAPIASGFNWAGYLVPFAALGVGAIALVTVLRGMQRRPSPAPVRRDVAAAPDDVTATADELAKLHAAIRRDE